MTELKIKINRLEILTFLTDVDSNEIFLNLSKADEQLQNAIDLIEAA